jgi:uncharacterized protein
MPPSADLTRTVLWRRLDVAGLEYAMLQASVHGWLLQGDAITPIGGLPARMVYQIRVTPDWHTHRVAVDLLVGAKRHRLHIVHHARRGWRTRPDNQPVAHIANCIDVDLGISPVTNTIAVNRLALEVGQSADIVTAWVRFPASVHDALTIAPKAQRYTRVEKHRYEYQSGVSHEELSYRATLDVDDAGLITYYEGGWVRQSQSDEVATMLPLSNE